MLLYSYTNKYNVLNDFDKMMNSTKPNTEGQGDAPYKWFVHQIALTVCELEFEYEKLIFS
jgi:hypothetical protein